MNSKGSASAKAMSIVRIFETGKAAGDYSAVTVLDDGAGISYGINQFTHRSGSLALVVAEYLRNGGTIGRHIFEKVLVLLNKTSAAAIRELSEDTRFLRALAAAGVTREMRDAQDTVAYEKYLLPAVRECERLGFESPLSLAVVCDSMTHGSWEKIRDRVGEIPGEGAAYEKAWITAYVRERDKWLRRIPRLVKTRYRTKFFLDQVAVGNWALDLPVTVHGVRLEKDALSNPGASVNAEAPIQQTLNFEPAGAAPELGDAGLETIPAATPSNTPPDTTEDGRSQMRAAPADSADTDGGGTNESEHCAAMAAVSETLDRAEEKVTAAAARYDQAERIVTTVITRKDAAKSLWTTVVGALWQTGWAIFGALSGMPREIWLAAAVAVGALMLVYLYRQVALGRIREAKQEIEVK